MLVKFAVALLFKKSRQWLMPTFVVGFSVFLLLQQFAAFRAVRGEVDGFCREIENVDLWVRGEHLGADDLAKVRRLPEVLLASFLYRGSVEANAPHGAKRPCILIGVDESTHLGLPSKVLYGQARLRGGDASALLTDASVKTLFKLGSQKLRSGSLVYLDGKPLKIGGVAALSKGPLIYTNLSMAKELASLGETLMVIKASSQTSVHALKQKIERVAGLKAYTPIEFSNQLFQSYRKENKVVALFSVVIVFGLVLALGIFAAIFTHFFKSQLATYSVLKALGATSSFLSRLLSIQAALMALIGWSGSIFIYMALRLAFLRSEIFFPLSLEIVCMTLGGALIVSELSALFVSLKIKEAL